MSKAKDILPKSLTEEQIKEDIKALIDHYDPKDDPYHVFEVHIDNVLNKYQQSYQGKLNYLCSL